MLSVLGVTVFLLRHYHAAVVGVTHFCKPPLDHPCADSVSLLYEAAS